MAWLRLFRSHFAVYYRGPTFVLFYSSFRRRSPSWLLRSNRIQTLWLHSRLHLPLRLLFHQHQRNQLRQPTAESLKQRKQRQFNRKGFVLACSSFPYSAYFSCYAVFSFSLVFHCQSSASFCTTCSFRFLSLALVCRLLASRFLFFLSSYVGSPAGSIVIYISSCVLLNLVLCRPFDRLQLFAVRATIISVSQCSAVTSFWPCVRLLEVFGRVFGY